MASNPIVQQKGAVTYPGIEPFSALARAVSGFNREQLGSAVEILIALLDASEPDPDVEANGDELDGSLAEDDFSPQNGGAYPGPGCPLSDPDLAIDDGVCDDIDQDREPEEPLAPSFGIDQTRSLPFSPGIDRLIMRPHRDYIRRVRCDRITYRGAPSVVDYRLRDEPVGNPRGRR